MDHHGVPVGRCQDTAILIFDLYIQRNIRLNLFILIVQGDVKEHRICQANTRIGFNLVFQIDPFVQLLDGLVPQFSILLAVRINPLNGQSSADRNVGFLCIPDGDLVKIILEGEGAGFLINDDNRIDREGIGLEGNTVKLLLRALNFDVQNFGCVLGALCVLGFLCHGLLKVDRCDLIGFENILCFGVFDLYFHRSLRLDLLLTIHDADVKKSCCIDKRYILTFGKSVGCLLQIADILFVSADNLSH